MPTMVSFFCTIRVARHSFRDIPLFSEAEVSIPPLSEDSRPLTQDVFPLLPPPLPIELVSFLFQHQRKWEVMGGYGLHARSKTSSRKTAAPQTGYTNTIQGSFEAIGQPTTHQFGVLL